MGLCEGACVNHQAILRPTYMYFYYIHLEYTFINIDAGETMKHYANIYITHAVILIG